MVNAFDRNRIPAESILLPRKSNVNSVYISNEEYIHISIKYLFMNKVSEYIISLSYLRI